MCGSTNPILAAAGGPVSLRHAFTVTVDGYAYTVVA